ncbi:hypothetical protein IE077_003275 [Cardiosporidium cionae]|uniref:Uncharacterized protein n=1 Tax=Cardiosporidium cionae TaxID=476202 RepID=A0ABQ7J8M5_9APIC|nr:hypothetical protein IE077_003275 [Cardiosporidium cionae]|eukprot:KAF8820346.1 hypothetical protein IE077_003275 [Cardiosporidium cionae]
MEHRVTSHCFSCWRGVRGITLPFLFQRLQQFSGTSHQFPLHGVLRTTLSPHSTSVSSSAHQHAASPRNAREISSVACHFKAFNSRCMLLSPFMPFQTLNHSLFLIPQTCCSYPEGIAAALFGACYSTTSTATNNFPQGYKLRIARALSFGVAAGLLLYGCGYGAWLFLDWPPPVQLALKRVREHPVILKEMGETLSFGWFWRGYVHDEHALIKLDVSGSNGCKGVALCQCQKDSKSGDWKILAFQFYQNNFAETSMDASTSSQHPFPLSTVITDDILAANRGHSVGIPSLEAKDETEVETES